MTNNKFKYQWIDNLHVSIYINKIIKFYIFQPSKVINLVKFYLKWGNFVLLILNFIIVTPKQLGNFVIFLLSVFI